ncbi:MAG: gene transfer agent family protein [Blastocatellia bacterium]|nr:gene transfer agent family protein [Blastocatellia bacterium]
MSRQRFSTPWQSYRRAKFSFALVERATDGKLSLSEIAALFDHVSAGRPEAITRERIGEAIVATGLANVTPQLRVLLGQILQGQ